MAKYTYVAFDPKTGERVKTNIEADNEKNVVDHIRKDGLTPIDVYQVGHRTPISIPRRVDHVSAKERVLFARQLSTLINAGLPLMQALRSVSAQTTSKSMKAIVDKVTIDVEGGSAFAAALAKYPKVFNAVFISLVEAGEASGTLDNTLDRLALQQEKDADIVSKVRSAMIYPLIVLLVMIAVASFMIVKVLPQVQVLYTTFPGASLPIETKLLLDLSHFIIKRWWLVVILVIVIVIFMTRYIKTKSGKRVFDTFKLKVPPLSTLFQKIYMARFGRTCATLVASGVPLLSVLSITATAVNNDLVSDSIHKSIEKVKNGKSLGDSLKGDPNFLPLVTNMISIGEQSGALDKMLEKVAEYYEKEVDTAIANISTLIEPVMMILLGLMAIVIVAAVLLPVYGLAGSGNISF
jgi:type IV pilus assembly protein PilC